MSSPFERGPVRRIFSAAHVRWSDFNWPVLVIAAVLMTAGMVFLQAMDAAQGESLRLGGVDFEGHKQKVLVTLPLLAAGLFLRPTWLRRNAPLVYVGSLLLLILVAVIGQERNNARRWIDLKVFDLQPSELAKLGLILMLARLLSGNRLERLRDWGGPLLAALIPMALVAKQPDLGTAMTLAPITAGMLYLAGARFGQLGLLLALGVGAGWAGYESGLIEEYQIKRVVTWASTWDAEELIDVRRGAGYHQYQARVAIGNGGVWGRGLGHGVANGAGHLPERDSDSVFAVIAEEAGFAGAAAMLCLYVLMVLLMMRSAAGIRDRFSRLVVGGIALYFGSHVFINASVNLGLLPMTGLTLPLISAGGSSLLATFLALGVALGLGSHHDARLDRDNFRSY